MVLPKPLVPIGDRPILQHIIGRLAGDGVTKIDICVGYLGGLIDAYLKHTSHPEGVEVNLHWETEPLGTAGALKLVPNLEEPFLVLNGDVLTTLDFRSLMEFHRKKHALLTVASHAKQIDLELGVIRSEDGWITDYREKPTLFYEVSMGIYVYEPEALHYLPEGPCPFPELVLRLLAAGKPVATCHSDAEWYDIGTLQEYERAVQEVDLRGEIYGL